MPQTERLKFRPKELAIVLSHYDIGAIGEIHSFKRGNPQSPKSLILAEKGKFLLKRRPLGRDDPYRVAAAHKLQMHLKQRGFCAPALIGTRASNSSMLQIYSAIYELFEFIEGEPYDRSIPSTTSAGRCLRQFHDLLKDYHPDYELPTESYHDCSAVRTHIQQMLPSISKHDSVADAQQAELQTISVNLMLAYDDAVDVFKSYQAENVDAVVCHGDWHPGNCIFTGSEVTAVFDYDSACLMPVLADVAVGCLQFSLLSAGPDPTDWPEKLDLHRAKAFLAGYEPEKQWSNDQLSALVALMTEALIAEAAAPIAATGTFAGVHGFRFLTMITRKVTWLQQHAVDALKTP